MEDFDDDDRFLSRINDEGDESDDEPFEDEDDEDSFRRLYRSSAVEASCVAWDGE